MWLLSQNKELLANVKNARVIYEFNSYHIVCDCDDCDYYYLAEYSTKEKAMKVIEMIQKQIVYCSEGYEIVKPVLKSDYFEPYWKKREVVFQMPKDEEVE